MTVKLMLAACAQVWAAVRMAFCQAARPNFASNLENRSL